MDESGDCASQIEQRVHLHSRLGRSKWCPVEQTQTQVDGGGVQRVDGGIEINAHGLFDVELPGLGNQAYGQRVINAPVPQIQCIGQSRTGGHVLQAHVKQLGLVGSEAHLDVAQRFAPGQLRKRHDTKHIGTTECANASVAVVAFNDATKRFPWHVLHDLCKKRLAGVHVVPQVVQTCEHRKCTNRAEPSTRLKTMKLGETRGFYDSTFSGIQIVDTRKPAQTRIGIGFVDDGL